MEGGEGHWWHSPGQKKFMFRYCVDFRISTIETDVLGHLKKKVFKNILSLISSCVINLVLD